MGTCRCGCGVAIAAFVCGEGILRRNETRFEPTAFQELSGIQFLSGIQNAAALANGMALLLLLRSCGGRARMRCDQHLPVKSEG